MSRRSGTTTITYSVSPAATAIAHPRPTPRANASAVAAKRIGQRYMTLRSTTRVENVVERYAPLIAAYQTKTARAATLVVTNARVRGSRGSSFGRASAETPIRSGRIPIPIASAPSAQDPCSKRRSL